ncbi:MAG: FtsX-like permease family protein [candidate division KSB1 bacterium]|nr:FtsX-like permease family protein [candidate division KSB1 bacterium]
MKRSDVVKKSLTRFPRRHVNVILGTAVATAILVGALVIGDSVRGSLKSIALMNLGQTHVAMESGDRYFTESLAQDMSADLGVTVAPVLNLQAMAVFQGGDQRANQVQALGVDSTFWSLAPEPVTPESSEGVMINSHLAQTLGCGAGDELLIRLDRPDAMPLDTPFAHADAMTLTRRFTVAAVIDDRQFGRYTLRTTQVAPLNVYLPLEQLGYLVDLPGRVNTLLAGNVSADSAQSVLQRHYTLEDAELLLSEHDGGTRIESRRAFIESTLAQNIKQMADTPDVLLTYLVNSLNHNNQSTPYSFVTAGTPAGNELNPDKIIVNDWLAADLNLRSGDALTLRYYILDANQTLREKQRAFTVARILPMTHPVWSPRLMPDFPGLDQENCRDWESGFPIDYDRIRDKDEAYWDAYRGTPKAIVSLKAGQDMWANRFGAATAIDIEPQPARTAELLNQRLHPRDTGLLFQPVRERALQSAQQSTNFSQLFIGLSFFIIIAALILTALLYALNAERRRREIGSLLAMGFTVKGVRRLLLQEGAILAVTGGLVGIPLGLAYNGLLILAVKTIWHEIVGTTSLHMLVTWQSLLTGFAAGVLTALASILIVIRRHVKQEIVQLQQGTAAGPWKSRRDLIIGSITVIAALILILTTNPGQDRHAAVTFFISGACLLIGGLAWICVGIARLWHATSKTVNLRNAGFRNIARRPGRSLSLVGLLAMGVFLVFMVGANRTSTKQDQYERSAGTGGFALFMQTRVPILENLNSRQGRSEYNLKLPDSVRFVPFRVKEGDEASCLNLNRISRPRILGLQPERLAQRDAFSFVSRTKAVPEDDPWTALDQRFDEHTIPGIADQTVITWSLQMTVGDTLKYLDENGDDLNIVLAAGLANSVFQGNILISQEHFVRHFPSVSGHRLFLVDAPPAKADTALSELSWALQDYGVDISHTSERLMQFARVPNTYLSIFMILGGLGLLLGSIGFGLVVLRNLDVRRNELGLLLTVGFDHRQLRLILFAEHAPLMLTGILFGALASLLAVWPAITAPGADVPVVTMLVIVIVLLISGAGWTQLAIRNGLKGRMIEALRSE